MIIDSIHFRGHRCFSKDWAGFETIKPVNILIGRNNTGKSHLLDLVEAICEKRLQGRNWTFRLEGTLDESSLKSVFGEHHIEGNLWIMYGRHFVGRRAICETDASLSPRTASWEPCLSWRGMGPDELAKTQSRLMQVFQSPQHHLSGKAFRRLLADRDIHTEPAEPELTLLPDGAGATNIVRRLILTADPQYDHKLIQKELLAALSEIFAGDGQFTEIQVRLHDDVKTGKPDGHWEVYLGEQKKALIPLSNSGSGLKTVLLVLLNLLVVPSIAGRSKDQFVFAFEELENNLHPALLRRLLQYLERYAITEKATIFLTTHASTTLDLFGISPNAQIIHITHDGESARATPVSAHFDRLGVISELGAKPSDLLQANGIIWVEGPSDCLYINRWLELCTGGRLKEGRDYQCAFYGGALLARTQFVPPEEAEAELVNLFRVNPNIIVVCDGDRSGTHVKLKKRVRRISREVKKIPLAHVWVTQAREIENYIPGSVLTKALSLKALPDPTQYDAFFPRKGSPGASYVETQLSRKGVHKMDLAALSLPHMDSATMAERFDWKQQMEQMVKLIDSWNR